MYKHGVVLAGRSVCDTLKKGVTNRGYRLTQDGEHGKLRVTQNSAYGLAMAPVETIVRVASMGNASE